MIEALISQIKASLTPDLLKPKYRSLAASGGFTAGHCYHASEALWHALGGRESGWIPQVYREPTDTGHRAGITHWWLRHMSGIIADPTAEQYAGDPLPYERGHGKGCGFLTKTPSKPAQTILRRIAHGL